MVFQASLIDSGGVWEVKKGETKETSFQALEENINESNTAMGINIYQYYLKHK